MEGAGTARPAVAAILHAAEDLRAEEPPVADGPAVPEATWGELRRDAAIERAVTAALRAGDDATVEAIAQAYGALLTTVVVVRGGEVVLESVSVAERRRRGAFATPAPLAATLARHALAGPASSVVDPACGPGALLMAALERLLAVGLRADAAFDALYGVDADATAVTVCRARLIAAGRRLGLTVDPERLAGRIVRGDALQGPTPRTGPHAGARARDAGAGRGADGAGEVVGLAWHEAFPQVLDRADGAVEEVTGWRGGFDAVLANPPWERLKVTQRDWAGLPPSGLRADRAAEAATLREAGRHPLTASGELNSYLPFAETCWRLLSPTGRAALVVPAGIASDRSAAALMGETLARGALEVLHLLESGAVPFDGVSRRVSVAVVVLGSGPQVRRPGRTASVAVGVTDPDAVPAQRTWHLGPALLRRVNPNTATVPLFGGERDALLVGAVHRRLPVLKLRDGDGRVIADPWQLRLVTPFHMTRDARHFRPAPAPGLLPLWEAKHAGLLDHRGGGTRGPRYWVAESLVHDRFGRLAERGWLAGYRNVTTADSPRTLLPTALPVVGVGNSLPLIDAPRLPLLLAALASLPADYVVRQKHAGANLNFFKLEQAALPPPSAYDVAAPWEPGITLATWVLRRFAAACRWDEAMAPLAAELARLGAAPPAVGGESVREQALAELDAAHALLFGFDREDLDQVLSTFPAVRARDEREHGRFVTAERVMAAFDRLEVDARVAGFSSPVAQQDHLVT